jgi:type VI secretion system VgrG family protein
MSLLSSVSSHALAQGAGILAGFSADTRLYDLEFLDGNVPLFVESWVGKEELSSLYEFRITCLSTSAALDLQSLLGRQAVLHTRLADGTRQPSSGYVSAAAYLGEDGGFARYRITLVPWLWFATQRCHSRVFQDQSVIDIVEAVFAADAERTNWRLVPGVAEFLAEVRPRSYCCQYRESDYDFISRLLAEEGIGFHFEEEPADTQAPTRHRLVLFVDSTQFGEVPGTDGGIRFHRHAAVEKSDSIQGFHAHRTLQAAVTTLSTWDYKAKRAITASLATAHDFAGPDAPHVESFDWSGVYAFATQDEAEHYARIARDAADARFKHWFGNSGVRSMRAGTTFTLLDSPLEQGAALGMLRQEARRFSLLGALHAGVNNLAGALPQPDADAAERMTRSGDWLDAEAWDRLLRQARATGYANRFTAIRADVCWRPVAADGTGLLLNPKPTAQGSQTAIVVGADGSTVNAGTVHTDHLGRIRIRFHWQQDESNTCWVRVAQLFAGPGYGAQFTPRIGHEVMVKFLDNDIDRPIVTGVLYNGCGEIDASAFAAASDHTAAGQANTTGGAASAWHGAATEHRHAGYLSGFKTVALGADGYTRQSNQLVFDDTTGRLRTQLATDTAATQLNLGHLIHQADNYRGSYRGTGWEMRTDAFGAIRAGKGVLITTYGDAQQPAGENSAGIALAKQMQAFAETFNRAVATHQTVQFILVKGNSINGGKGSKIDGDFGPMAAMIKALSGTVDAGDGTQIPHMAQPLVTVVAEDGIGVAASKAIHIASGEATHLHSARDMHVAAGDTFTMHSGQAIGVLAGAEKAGEDGIGLSLIAGKDDIDIQAQSDTLTLASKDLMQILSANSHVDLAAAKSITIKTEGGASMTIEGGNITFVCPGTISIKSAAKSFTGPTRENFSLPELPAMSGTSSLRWQALSPETGKPISQMPYQIIKNEQIVMQGKSGNDGRTDRHFSDEWGESLKVMFGAGEWSTYGMDRITPNEYERGEMTSKEEGENIG